VVKEVGGRRVGIIGYVTPETKDLASTGKVKFLSEIQSIRNEAQRLKTQGVDIIIAVGHSGYEVDQEIGKQVGSALVVKAVTV
jgi:5'-nucleotidase